MTILCRHHTYHAELVSASPSIDNENANNIIPDSVRQKLAGAYDIEKNVGAGLTLPDKINNRRRRWRG
jgi:hypothetical protein